MSREKTSRADSPEAVRNYEELQQELEAIAAQGRDLAAEKNTDFNGLVWEEAMALGRRMLAMEHPLNLRRLIGGYAVGIKDEQILSYERHLRTPLLLVSEAVEPDESRRTQGWQFMTRAQRDYYGKRSRGWEPIGVHIIKHTEALEAEGSLSEETKILNLQKKGRDGMIDPVFSLFDANGYDDPELLDIYALLNMARQELGDKKAKKVVK
jgi:hypothetical protein